MSVATDRPESTRGMPLRGVAGVGLIAVSWFASWSQVTWLARHSFFPLWLGYVFVVEACTFKRSRTSMFARDRKKFGGLFAISIPLWWIFEAFNARLGNWTYELPHHYSWIAYHTEASIAFSAVVPALFVTAEFYGTFDWPNQIASSRVVTPGRTGWRSFMLAGIVFLAAVVAWPDVFFPLVWIGLFLFVDPFVHLIGGRSIAGQIEHGWWRTVWLLFAAGITCGFFWEMWNSRAMPKWQYDIPYAEWFHIFEMPLLGYGGYLPFALETYALVMLVDHLTGWWPTEFTKFDTRESSMDQTGT